MVMGFDRVFGDAEPAPFSWGTAVTMSARDTLMSLLEKSSTSMSRKLNVGPILVESRDEQGKLSTVPLQHDRCQKCPPCFRRRQFAPRS